MKFANIKTSTALKSIVIFVTAGFLIIGIIGGTGINRIMQDQNELYLDRYLPTTQIYEIHTLTDNTLIEILKIKYAGYSTNGEMIIKEDRKSAEYNIAEYMKNMMTEEETSVINELKQTIINYYDSAEKYITQIKNGKSVSPEDMLKFEAVSSEIEKDLKVIVKLNLKLSEELDNDTDKSAKLTLELFIALSLFIITLLAVPSFFIIRFFSHTVSELTTYCSEAASGNLKAQINDSILKSKNELGIIAFAVHRMIGSISDSIRKIRDISNEVASSSEEMAGAATSFSDNAQSQSASTEEMTATIEEVSSGMEGVANNAFEQYNNLEDFISMMVTMTANLEDMDKQLGAAQTASVDIINQAKSGSDSLTLMKDSMESITSSSAEMTAIVSMINDISDKINLLSLNAAIEAARAGDAGRGFAVVADEISKLADSTASSIKNIDRLIKSNNTEIQNGRNNIKDTTESITTIINAVNEIGNMMNRLSGIMLQNVKEHRNVNEAAKSMQDRSNEIKSATDEQKVAMNEIVKSVANINEHTQTNAAGAEEISGTSESLASMADSMRSVVDTFSV